MHHMKFLQSGQAFVSKQLSFWFKVIMPDTRLITGNYEQLKIRVLPWKSHFTCILPCIFIPGHCWNHVETLCTHLGCSYFTNTMCWTLSKDTLKLPDNSHNINLTWISTVNCFFVPFFKMLPPSEDYMSALLLIHRHLVHIYIFSQLLSICAKFCCIPVPQNVGNLILYHQWTIHLVKCLVWTSP